MTVIPGTAPPDLEESIASECGGAINAQASRRCAGCMRKEKKTTQFGNVFPLNHGKTIKSLGGGALDLPVKFFYNLPKIILSDIHNADFAFGIISRVACMCRIDHNRLAKLTTD